MTEGISVLTVMHDDFEFIESYCIGVTRLTENSELDIEVLVYFWECDESFVRLAKSQIDEITNVTSEFFEGPNIGFSRGNNFLASYARHELLFFLNPDTEIQEFDVVELNEINKTSCIIEPLLTTGTSEDASVANLQRGTYLSNDVFFYPRTTRKLASQTYVDGAALMIAKSYFDQLGGFDENIFVFQEDMDLGLRNLIRGGRFQRLQGTHVHHFSGGTVGGGAYKANSGRHVTSYFRRIEAEKNQVYIACKYFTPFGLFLWLTCWSVLNVFSTILLFLVGEKKLALTPWQGLSIIRRENKFGADSKSELSLKRSVIKRFTLVPSKIVVFFRHGMPKSNVSA